MALERQKQNRLQAAESLLKQGKTREALASLEQVSLSSPGVLLGLNRISDLLAKQGQNEDAIRFYGKVADEFSRTGFYPKAVAIHKKILRLEPDSIESLIQLGDLYLQQRLPGEAKKYLLHAAELGLKAQDFAAARSVYEKLIEAEPGDPRHRARLAETRAAEGDTEQAGEELVLLGDTLFTQGKPVDAEQTYRRAADLLPDRPEPVLGVYKSLQEQGREEESLHLLEERTEGDDPAPALVGELAVHHLTAGNDGRALEVLRRTGAEQIPADTMFRAFHHQIDSGRVDAFWEQMDPVLDSWAERGSPQRLEALLVRLGTLEKNGHIPALQRLYERTKEGEDRREAVHALEELVRAYQARSMADEASLMLDRLRALAPESPLVAAKVGKSPEPGPGPGAKEPSKPTEPQATPRASGEGEADGALPVEAEAPAVPLNRTDEEFVAGRLTQAEILEKYGLFDQALQQVREVTEKFPGHVPAQERLATILRSGGSRTPLREALVGLALARRASGDAAAAREAAEEANTIAALDEQTRKLLERLGLLEETVEVAPPSPPEPVAAAQENAPASSGAAPVSAPSDDGGVLIDFDSDPGQPLAAQPPPAFPAPVSEPRTISDSGGSAGGKQVRAPGSDMLEEIRLLLRAGMAPEANRRVETLRVLGYASPDLDELEAAIQESISVTSAPPETALPEQGEDMAAAADSVAAAPPEEPGSGVGQTEEAEDSLAAVATDLVEDDDLATITAALESELFAEEAEAPVPEAQSEQSLEDVFAAFKQHVADEVGSEDYRTHYDLGIAYKEMGLVEEAIGEFGLAVKSAEMMREAAIMLAICHRDRQEPDRAAEWYRRALEAPGGDSESVAGLRYDLAEVLLEAGALEQALEAFRGVLQSNASFRDVRERVEQVESRLTSKEPVE